MQNTTSILELRDAVVAAYTYLAHGWQPVPVPLGQKGPMIKNWQQLRFSPSDIPTYFCNSNIGLLLGEPSGGLVDVDLDSPEALVCARYFLPATGLIHGRAGKPQSHWWYKASQLSGIERFNAPDGTCLVELRANGQTIVPLSIHPSGEVMVWEQAGEPAQIEAESLRQSVRHLAVAALLAKYWPSQGNREGAAMAAAGFLLRHGLTLNAVEHIVGVAAWAAGDTEWGKRAFAVRDTAANLAACKHTTGGVKLAELLQDGPRVLDCIGHYMGLKTFTQVDEWETPMPFDEEPTTGRAFPVEALPEPVRSFVNAQATFLQIPGDLAACLVIGTGAAAAAGGFIVYLNDEWQEPLNMYVAVALPSGERKSPTFRAITRPLEEAESEMIFIYGSEIEMAKADKDILEAKLREAKARAAKADAAEADECLAQIAKLTEHLRNKKLPKSPRLLADDATSEAVAGLLAEYDGRIAIMSTEGGLFETMAGRYADRVPNIDIYLKAYSGDPVRVDRRTRAPEFIPHPSLTMCLTVQPAVIRGLFTQEYFRGRGLLARFLYSIPESKVGYRSVDVQPVPEELKREWSRIISNILSFSVAEQGQKNQIVLGPEAAAVFRDFRMKSEERLRPEGDLAAIPDWGNKYPGTAARLAGILHLFQHAGDEAPWSIPVDKSTLESAISIGKYFVEHAILAYNLMGTSPGLEKAKRLWAIICSYGLSRFTLRDLHQRRRRSFTKEDLTIALDVLTRHGYIRPVDMSLGKRVGRPASQEYEVNLLVCTQNSQNSQKDAGENSFENSVNFENSSCSSDNPEEIKPETVLRQNSDEDWLEVP